MHICMLNFKFAFVKFGYNRTKHFRIRPFPHPLHDPSALVSGQNLDVDHVAENIAEGMFDLFFKGFCCLYSLRMHPVLHGGCASQVFKSVAGSQEGWRHPRDLTTRLSSVEVRDVYVAQYSPRSLQTNNIGPGGYVAAIKAAQLGLKVRHIVWLIW